MKNSGSVVVVSDTTPLLADPTQDPNPSTIVRYESIGDDVEGYSSGSDEEAAPKKQDFSFGSVLALLLIGTNHIFVWRFFKALWIIERKWNIMLIGLAFHRSLRCQCRRLACSRDVRRNLFRVQEPRKRIMAAHRLHAVDVRFSAPVREA